MYQIENKSDYWVHDLQKDSFIHLDNYDELINWASTKITPPHYSFDPDMYSQFNFTGKDLLHYMDYVLGDDMNKYKFVNTYYLRRYIVYDAHWRSIDIRRFDKDIQEARKTVHKRVYNPRKAVHEVGEKLYIRGYHKDITFRFRRGPVSRTGKSCHWGRYTPSQKIYRLIKNNENYRPKARVPLDWWGEDKWERHCDRSWKSSYKCRYQWEKHLKKKGVYYEQVSD